MRALLFVTLFGCAEVPTPNLAIVLATTLDPGAVCTALHVDASATHVHSAICQRADRSWSFCSVSTDKGPICSPIEGQAKK